MVKMVKCISIVIAFALPLFAQANSKSAFATVPKQALVELRATVGKPFSSGLVFVNGKFLDPPYKIERYGTAIRINGVQVTNEIIPWTEFLKTQGRFKHMFKPGNEWTIEAAQADVDERWEKLLRRPGFTFRQISRTFLGKNPAAGAATHAVPVSDAADTAPTAAQVSGAAGAVRFLQSRGFFCAAMALTDNSVSVDDPALHGAEKCALFLGSEGPGLPEDAVRACDLTVKLPMANGVDSLNVAAAAAVAFWELTRGSRAAAREGN